MHRWFNRSLYVAVLAVLVAPLSAMAAENPYATYTIKVDNNPAVTSDINLLEAAPMSKGKVAFRIFNNTDKPLYFEKHFIPLTSQETVVTSYQPGQEYKVVDTKGATVAAWQVGVAPPIRANVTPATAQQFAEWGSKLQVLIENQKVSYQEPAPKADPSYYRQSSPSRSANGSVIRGYW